MLFVQPCRYGCVWWGLQPQEKPGLEKDLNRYANTILINKSFLGRLA
jgi:hypothetical protein